MESTHKYDLIITIVNKGYSDYVVQASREAGATGGTIINALSSSANDTEKFLGVTIHPEKEIVLTVVKTEDKAKIMKNICESTNLDTIGRGMCFALPVSKLTGLTALNSKNKK
ncbi:MAG: P-II family nitrogen regulator [Clostridia bacterium]|nr:P-II family nitrogen regulator [Clostridia bacterium]